MKPPTVRQERAKNMASAIITSVAGIGIWSALVLGVAGTAEAGGGFCTDTTTTSGCAPSGCLATQIKQVITYAPSPDCGPPVITCLDSTGCGAVSNTPPTPTCNYTVYKDTTCVTRSFAGTTCSNLQTMTTYTADLANPSSCAGNSATCFEEPPCSNWQPYGYASPGDPHYGFTWAKDPTLPAGTMTRDGAVLSSAAVPPLFPNPTDPADDPFQYPFLGLAAKGNVVIGDYTNQNATFFQNAVLPALVAHQHAYAIDPTDEPLGYHTGADLNGDGTITAAEQYEHGDPTKPLFDGNYNQNDGGTKLDGSPRRFYESSLSRNDFLQLIDRSSNDPLFPSAGNPTGSGACTIQAMIYTNHALMGFLEKINPILFGGLVARDDALMWRQRLALHHDPRAMNPAIAQKVMLPVIIKHPTLIALQDCDAHGVCP